MLASKTVMMIAFEFPPAIGPASIRAGKFAKYLPNYGWRPVVLSVHINRRSPVDSSLLSDVQSNTVVQRTKSWVPAFKGIDRLKKWFPIPGIESFWLPAALMAGRRLLSNYRCDVIWSTSPPPACHIVGMMLKESTGLPLVLDYRDLWTDNPYIRYPTRLHRQINFAVEKKVLSRADGVVTISHPMLQRILGLKSDIPVQRVIPNGYDPADFSANDIGQHQRIVVSHLGAIYGARIQSARLLIDGLAILEKKRPELAHLMRLELIGMVDEQCPRWARERLRLIDVSLPGSIPHAAAISKMQQASVLVLLVDPSEMGSVTSKVYEYLVSGRPILIVGHSSAVRDLCRDLEDCAYVSDSNPGAVAEALEKLLGTVMQGSAVRCQEKRKRLLEPFSRRRLAGELAEVFDFVTKGRI